MTSCMCSNSLKSAGVGREKGCFVVLEVCTSVLASLPPPKSISQGILGHFKRVRARWTRLRELHAVVKNSISKSTLILSSTRNCPAGQHPALTQLLITVRAVLHSPQGTPACWCPASTMHT